MVIAQIQRQHRHRLPSLTVPDRHQFGARQAKDRQFRRIDDRRERRAADAAEVGDRHRCAAHFVRFHLAGLRAGRQIGDLGGDGPEPLAIHVTQHWHHQTVRRVHRDADMEELLQDQGLARRVERGVESRELGQTAGQRLDLKGQRRQLDAPRLSFGFQFLAERLDPAHVGAVVMRDLRDHGIGRRQIVGGHACHPCQRFLCHRPVLAVVNRPVAAVIRAGWCGSGTARQMPVDIFAGQRFAPGGGGERLQIDALVACVASRGGTGDIAHDGPTTQPRYTGFP